jgi:hypothetical protein
LQANGNTVWSGHASGALSFGKAILNPFDASRIAHVLILGGNDINNPSAPLNTIYCY